MAVVSSYCKM